MTDAWCYVCNWWHDDPNDHIEVAKYDIEDDPPLEYLMPHKHRIEVL